MDERAGFGLYVHWPWCQAKCPYCDFNSHVAAQIDQDGWARAYEADIAAWGARTGRRRLDSVFFGGGTPSLMAPAVVDRILAAARTVWDFANDIEITLEANPTSVEAGKFRDFRLAGVNRVSVGLQALQDADLRRLGRMHTVDEGLAALDVAQGVFDRVNADVIYARQDQSLTDWEAELKRLLSFGLRHLSLYQLTVEEGTPFAARHAIGGLRGLPDEDLAADMFALTADMTGAAGLGAYEVSNHATVGEECRHNLTYWRGGDWVGTGPGAHGRLTLDGARLATEGHRSPQAWLSGVEARQPGAGVWLDEEDVLTEFVMMGLRTREGLPMARLSGPQTAKIIGQAHSLSELAVVELADGYLRLTDRGRPLLNAVVAKLLV